METEGKQVAYHRQYISPLTDTQYNQEHTKAEVMANSHDYTQYILSNGLSITTWQQYPPPILKGRNRRFQGKYSGHCLLRLNVNCYKGSNKVELRSKITRKISDFFLILQII